MLLKKQEKLKSERAKGTRTTQYINERREKIMEFDNFLQAGICEYFFTDFLCVLSFNHLTSFQVAKSKF